MKRTWVVITALAAVATVGCDDSTEPLAAQEVESVARVAAPDSVGRGFAGRVLAHADELELTDAQRAELETIRDEVRVQSEPLREQVREIVGEDADRAAMRNATPEQREQLRSIFQQLRGIRKAAADDVQGILTESQRAMLTSLRPRPGSGPSDERRRFRSGDGNREGTRPMGMTGFILAHATDLGLTSEQQASLQALGEQLRPSFDSSANVSRESRRAAMKETMQEMRQQIESILTAEQIEQLRALAPERGRRQGGGSPGHPGGRGV